MPHENSVFHELLKLVPWDTFDRLVAQHGADAGERSFKTKSQFVALLYGQLAGADSLRAIELGMQSHGQLGYHLGCGKVRRSSLAEANAKRPAALYVDLLAALINRTHRSLRSDLRECIRLIDSTGIHLNNLSVDWARYSAGVCGAKIHVIYDPDADCPLYASVTPSRVNDITAAKGMPIEAGATYVFDLGYYDYAWWAKLQASGCRIVTRFKTNTPLTVERENAVSPEGPILSDRIGYLPARQTKNRKKPILRAGARNQGTH